MNLLLWVVVPYVCLTTFVVGHLWRYRYDKFGWTTHRWSGSSPPWSADASTT